MNDDPIKVLAVDDEKFNLLLLQSCLKNENCFLKTSTNAIDALNEFKKEHFDVVLLDILMDGIDGFEIRHLIREFNKEIPIIFLTSMVDDINSSLLNRIASDQYSYYMNKSFNKENLLTKIEQAVMVYREHQSANRYHQRLEEDLILAGDVQRIMLPRWCEITPQMEFSYLYEPHVRVSGDMLDLIKLDEHRSLVFIGDIAGHGVQAALYMSAIQSFLKVLLLGEKNTELKPHVILNRIEDFFRNDLGGKNYMTCIVAIFDFAANHLSFQSAGHPGIICCSPEEGKAWLIDSGERGGLPVGLSKQNQYYPEDTVEYDFDDRREFIFYTDGVLDVSNRQGETLDEETFLALLGSLAGETDVIATPYRILNSLKQIGYSNVPDDISILALKKNLVKTDELSCVIRSDTREVSRCASDFASFVEHFTTDEKKTTEMELLLSEFLNNVIVHGLKTALHSQTDIFIRLMIHDNELRVLVFDRGQEWNEPVMHSSEEVLEKQNHNRATSGRGIAIIYNIVSSITRNHYHGINQTVFTVKRKD